MDLKHMVTKSLLENVELTSPTSIGDQLCQLSARYKEGTLQKRNVPLGLLIQTLFSHHWKKNCPFLHSRPHVSLQKQFTFLHTVCKFPVVDIKTICYKSSIYTPENGFYKGDPLDQFLCIDHTSQLLYQTKGQCQLNTIVDNYCYGATLYQRILTCVFTHLRGEIHLHCKPLPFLQ